MENPIRQDDVDTSMHVCFVTGDLDGTLAWFCDLIGQDVPAINGESSPDIARATLHGQPAEIGFRQANLWWRGTRVEFIEPGESDSTWREWLTEHGTSVHHIGFDVKDLDGTGGELEAAGFGCTQAGHFPGGRYAYNDTSAKIGTMVELIEMSSGA